jgi:hypothetical protein
MLLWHNINETKKETIMKTLNATQFDKYTPEHDAIMKADLTPVFGAFDLYTDDGFPISVKVPSYFTFVKFESGWDQDDYIHNNKADLIVKQLGLAYKALNDCPRYTDKHCANSLRYFFTSVAAAEKFIEAVQSQINYQKQQNNNGDSIKTAGYCL